MKRRLFLLAALALACCATACATAYQRQGATGGFSETQLDENVFQVSFKGNGYTDRDRANDFALLRSAEITLEKGYKYFVIVDTQQYSKQSSVTTPTTAKTSINATTYGSAYGYGNGVNYSGNTYGTATTTYSGGQTFHITKPRTTNTIVLLKGKPEGFSYNAEFLAKSLKQKYGIDVPNK